MASVEDRWHRPVRDDMGKVVIDPETRKPVLERTDRYGIGRRWLLRWRDTDHKECKLSYDKWSQADNKRKEIEADLLRGSYIDPKAGIQTFGAYTLEWLARQTTDPLTREEMANRLRRYVEDTPLWKAQLRRIRPSTIQAWVAKLPAIAESTKAVVFTHVSAILAAAVADELIAKNSCTSPSVRRPRPDTKEVVPWDATWVAGMHAALPERYQPFVTLGAGLGLRQGEMFGLSPDDIDWLRGWVSVERQVKIVAGRLVYALPKGRKTRRVPLPPTVRDDLAAYLVTFPAKTVTLPWEEPDGEPVTVKLLITTRQSNACNRNHCNTEIWKPALERVGIEPSRENGFHALRHYFASVLLDGGENIKALSKYLGHASAAFTLKTYTHLMPASEDRTKTAVDNAIRSWCAPSVPQPTDKEALTSDFAQK